jgi:hypothetical protein
MEMYSKEAGWDMSNGLDFAAADGGIASDEVVTSSEGRWGTARVSGVPAMTGVLLFYGRILQRMHLVGDFL